MPLIQSGSKEAVHSNIKELMKAGHKQKQAIAISLANQRKHMAMGGPVEDNMDNQDNLSTDVDDIDKDTDGSIAEALEAADVGFAGGGEVDAAPMDMEPEAPESTAKMPMLASALPEDWKEKIRKRKESSVAHMKAKHKKG